MKEEELPIDELTNCIVSRETGEEFDTELVEVTEAELKRLYKKDGWSFIWKSFLAFPERRIYKLVLVGDDTARIQGLVSLEEKAGFIEVHHVENAPHNKHTTKEFVGVGGNLFAFGCKESFRLNMGGYVSFIAKTKLIDHYEKTLGATLINARTAHMIIYPPASKNLVNLYFKNFFNEA